VEFTIVMPLAMALLVGLFDLGRVVWANDVVASAAAEAVRFAIVRGGSFSTLCPVGPAAGTATIPAPSGSCPYPSPSKQSIVNQAITKAWAVGGTVRAQACYGVGCTGDTDIAGATNARGQSVTVTVTADLALVVPALLGDTRFTVTTTSTMLVDH